MNFKNLFGLTCAFGLAAATSAFALPKSSELVAGMGMGFNIGNTLEAPSDPTSWGNSLPTQVYIDSIKAAGFNTVRLPTAWFSHVKNGQISKGWMDTVQTVVDMCIKKDMYVVLNSHWDTGWLEDHVFVKDSAVVNKQQKAIWSHIADRFKAYDEHLIFASANEPGVNDPWNGTQLAFDEPRQKTLQKYHQTMLDAVRSSGGNNETRTVVFQMPRTEIDNYKMLAENYPVDPAGEGYTMAEAHYYPYQFSLMEEDESWGKTFWFWEDITTADGAAHTCTGNASTLGTKAHIDAQFDLLKTTFGDKGIPVIIGEMGAIKRLSLKGEDLRKHLESRAAWYGYVAKSAKAHGIVPIVWDTGAEDDKNMTIIRRQKSVDYTIFDYETLNAMREAYGMSALVGNSIDALVEKSLIVANNSAVAFFKNAPDTNATSTLRINVKIKDWSNYTGATVRIFTDFTTAGAGWTSTDFVTMSGSKWDWTQAHMGSQLKNKEWSDVKIKFSSNAADETDDNMDAGIIYIPNIKSVNSVVINTYSVGMTGKLAVDHITLDKADGTCDTLEAFTTATFEKDGYVSSVSTVLTDDVASATGAGAGDKIVDYKFVLGTYTDSYIYPEKINAEIAAIKPAAIVTASKMSVNVQQGFVNATFSAEGGVQAKAMLMNTMGQVIASESFVTRSGNNTIQLKAETRGPAILMVKQGSQVYSQKVILK